MREPTKRESRSTRSAMTLDGTAHAVDFKLDKRRARVVGWVGVSGGRVSGPRRAVVAGRAKHGQANCQSRGRYARPRSKAASPGMLHVPSLAQCPLHAPRAHESSGQTLASSSHDTDSRPRWTRADHPAHARSSASRLDDASTDVELRKRAGDAGCRSRGAVDGSVVSRRRGRSRALKRVAARGYLRRAKRRRASVAESRDCRSSRRCRSDRRAPCDPACLQHLRGRRPRARRNAVRLPLRLSQLLPVLLLEPLQRREALVFEVSGSGRVLQSGGRRVELLLR